jgi:hypothetical protein
MTGILNALLGFINSAAQALDPFFNQVVLLLHGDGTNGAQNNTFLDGSTNNFTITRNGNTTQGTFSPFSGPNGYWGNYFDGNGDSLTVPDNSALEIGSGDFTVEAWIYLDKYASAYGSPTSVFVSAICGKDATTGRSYNLQIIGTASSYTTLRFEIFSNDSTSTQTAANFTFALNTWYHVAATRSGTSLRLYVNGTDIGGGTNSVSAQDTATTFKIGTIGFTNFEYWFPGYISNLRVVKGTAVYTSAFTPSTTPLTAITNTSLLTCQSNRFVDNSTNAFAITRNGDVRVTPFSPFAPSAAYDPAVNGGSGYFDGTGDYLTTPSDIALAPETGLFTWECWFYPTEAWFQDASGGDGLIQSSATNGMQISRTATGVSPNGNFWGLAAAGVAFRLTTTSLPTVGQWNHMAVARSGTGTNQTALFLNGGRVAQGTVTQDFVQGSYDIGRRVSGYESTGYIANMRLVKGSAVYNPANSTYTIPTAPLTAITNTSLLCNFTNAGIFDNTGKNVLETVGDAQIDTGTKKYGTGSMEFDGTGDWLLMAHNPDQQLGTGNFTIEFWVYLASGDTGSARGLVAKGTSNTGWLVSLDSSQKVVFTYTSSTITSSGAITTNAWNHIAVVREGTGSNQTKIYIGGTNDGTGTVSTDFNQTSVMYVGCNRTAGDPMKGFIDDLRITKGVARYTANFTPPTAAFPNE